MRSVYSQLCRHVLLGMGDRLTGQRVTRYLALYQAAERWPIARLGAERDRLLRETVTTAYADVPFYRELYDRHGVLPSDVSGVRDLARLPVVTKAMLREAGAERCTRNSGLSWKEYSTSGSTGTPFVVRIDRDSMSRARALMLLRTMWCGWVPGDPTLQTGMSISRVGLKRFKDLLLRITYVSAWDLSDIALDRCLELIESRRIEFITGYAPSLYLLARRARALGFNRRLRGAVSWASNLTGRYRREIESAFGCPTFDSYGVGEGIQVASQCEAGTYHAFPLHSVCEFVHEGEPVRSGASGEILLTRLDAGVMPLIRYAVGDLGRGSDGAGCACGRTLPQIGGLEGRLGDIIVTASGRRLTLEFFFAVLQSSDASGIESFQVLQPDRQSIHVLIEPGPGFEWQQWESIRRRIVEEGDPELAVSAETVARIVPEPNGKIRHVIALAGS